MAALSPARWRSARCSCSPEFWGSTWPARQFARLAAIGRVMRVNPKQSPPQRALRSGDVVEVRPPAEILATLDADGAVDNMPFMPEMAKLVGKRFTVTRRVDKICDTVAQTGSRRMRDTVFLDDLRCDGSGHDGCQAGCKIYWKEAWLRRVDEESSDD